jgi:hypothetical protein
MATFLNIGYNVRNWAIFKIADGVTTEQIQALRDAIDSDENDDALELASKLEAEGLLEFDSNERDTNPGYWGNTETGICTNIIDVYEED